MIPQCRDHGYKNHTEKERRRRNKYRIHSTAQAPRTWTALDRTCSAT